MGGQSSLERCQPPKIELLSGHWVATSSPLNEAYSEEHLASLTTEKEQKMERRFRELYESAVRAAHSNLILAKGEFEEKAHQIFEKREKNVTYGINDKVKSSNEAREHTLNVWDAKSAQLISELATPRRVPIRCFTVLGHTKNNEALRDLEKLNFVQSSNMERFPSGVSIMYQEESKSDEICLWNLVSNETQTVNLYSGTKFANESAPRIQWMVSLPHAKVVLVCASVSVNVFLSLRTAWSNGVISGREEKQSPEEIKGNVPEILAPGNDFIDREDEENLIASARTFFEFIHPIFVVSTATGKVIGFHPVDAPAHTIAGRNLYCAGSAGSWGALRKFDIAHLYPNCGVADLSEMAPQKTVTGKCYSPLKIVHENEMRELHNVVSLHAVPEINLLLACCRAGLSNDLPEHRYSGVVAMWLDSYPNTAKQPVGATVRDTLNEVSKVSLSKVLAARARVQDSNDSDLIAARAFHAKAIEQTVPTVLTPSMWLQSQGACESLVVVPTGDKLGEPRILKSFTDKRVSKRYSHLILTSCTSTANLQADEIKASPASRIADNYTSSSSQSQRSFSERSLGMRLGGHEGSFTGIEAQTRGWLVAVSNNQELNGPIVENEFWGRVLFNGQIIEIPGANLIAVKSFDSREPWIRFLDNRVRHFATWTPFAFRGVSALQLLGCEYEGRDQTEFFRGQCEVERNLSYVMSGGLKVEELEKLPHNRIKNR